MVFLFFLLVSIDVPSRPFVLLSLFSCVQLRFKQSAATHFCFFLFLERERERDRCRRTHQIKAPRNHFEQEDPTRGEESSLSSLSPHSISSRPSSPLIDRPFAILSSMPLFPSLFSRGFREKSCKILGKYSVKMLRPISNIILYFFSSLGLIDLKELSIMLGVIWGISHFRKIISRISSAAYHSSGVVPRLALLHRNRGHPLSVIHLYYLWSMTSSG